MNPHSTDTSGFPSASQIREHWRLVPLRIRPLRAGHGAQVVLEAGEAGDWVLKRARIKGRQLERLDIVLGALNQVGRGLSPPLMPEIRPLADRGHVLRAGGSAFYLMRKVSGRRADFRRFGDVLRVARAQARLHRASVAIVPRLIEALKCDPAADPRRTVVQSLETLDELTERLRRFKRRRRPLLVFARGGHRGFVELARAAFEFFENPWLEHKRREKQDGGENALAACALVLVHGDSHENNYLMVDDADRPPWMLDLESSDLRPGVLDLIVPLQYFGRANRWPIDRIEEIVAAYEAIRPLGPAEKALLGAQLIHPRHWERSLRSLLKRRGRFKWGTAKNLWRSRRELASKRAFAHHLYEHWRVD